MRICYVVSEYFRWGQYGGYGTITRAVASGLARRGHEVFALVDRKTEEARREQRDLEQLDGVTVVGLPGAYGERLRRSHLYRLPQADLYVGVDARFDSWLAMKLNPRARHAIWLVDPMPFDAYWRLHRDDPGQARPGEKLATRLAFGALQRFRSAAVRGADALLSQPRDLAERARRVYGTRAPIRFAPNPVAVPDGPIEKAARPLVLFLGRFDWQKQPQAFFELARRMPDLDFVAAGAARDGERDAALRAHFGRLPNLQLPGVVRGREKDRLLRRAWILCNTSLREGLPRSFQEALAYGCAIVSGVDPDGYASRYGYHARVRDFDVGIRKLVDGGRWAELGAAGRAYICETHETRRALDVHESLYRELVA